MSEGVWRAWPPPPAQAGGNLELWPAAGDVGSGTAHPGAGNGVARVLVEDPWHLAGGTGLAGASAGRNGDSVGGRGHVSTDGGPLGDGAPLRGLEYVVVDVETTGGSSARGHRMTELAVVRVRGSGEVVGEFSTLLNPERSIPPFITRLTRITNAMARDAPLFGEVAEEVVRLLSGSVFVAHNAGFDWRFLGAELIRTRGGCPELPQLCTVRLSRRLVPEVPSRSLDALSYYFGIENEARHRAYGDARATTVLLAHLLERLEEREVGCWGELQEFLRRRRPRRKRTALPISMEDA